MANILAADAAISKDFANDNVYLLNGKFAIDMLQITSFNGGASLWFATPMAVGYSTGVVNPPLWFILFNEIGKDTTLNSPVNLPFGGNTDGNASEIYSETMGDIFSYGTGFELVNKASFYGISNDVASDIGNSLLGGAAALKAQFDSYVASGAPFSSWNPYNGGPDPTVGTITSLAWKFIEHAQTAGTRFSNSDKAYDAVLANV